MSRKQPKSKAAAPRGGLPVDNARLQGQALKSVNDDAAGIDVGATMHFVAVPEGRDEVCVRSFGAYTADLEGIADWLARCGVTTVAMESTGVYWIPLYELLQRRGFEVLLVEPSQVKKVPGRKSDVLDCQWIQRLHNFGLLRASFRPEDAIVVLRSYLRQRDSLVRYAAKHVQHMQKALEQMNVKLTEVLADITGMTGTNIIEAILAGQRDPQTLAKLRHERCKNDEATIALALHGNWRDEHSFALRQALDLYGIYQQKLSELDVQIEAYLKTFADRSAAQPVADQPVADQPVVAQRRPKKKPQRSKHEPALDTRGLLSRMTGVDLTTIDGIGAHAALQLISEIGTDMNRWQTDKHFCSWLSLCPGVNKSGGRQQSRSGRTRPSTNRAAQVLRLCAQSLLRADCALGAFGRRMRARLGGPKAITAIAHKLAKIVYGMLKHGKPYVDQGANYYQERYHTHLLNNLRRRAEQLGYALAPAS